MNLLFATTNKGKLEEARSVLSPAKICSVSIELFEPREEGQLAVAEAKAGQALKAVGKPVFVEDSCFYLDAYPGFPGEYSKLVVRKIGGRGVLKLLEGRQRGARFVTILAFAAPRKRLKIFKGECRGRVLERIAGKPREGMHYDSIFAPTGAKKSFARMNKAEKSAYSHRGKALRAFAKWLVKQNDA